MEVKICPKDISVHVNLYKEGKDVSLCFYDNIDNFFEVKISIEVAKTLGKEISRHNEIR